MAWHPFSTKDIIEAIADFFQTELSRTNFGQILFDVMFFIMEICVWNVFVFANIVYIIKIICFSDILVLLLRYKVWTMSALV